MMVEEQIYDEWIANRRTAEPSRELADRVMAAVEERDARRMRYVSLADRINQSPPARWAACMAALLVGSVPFFLFVAYVAQVPVI